MSVVFLISLSLSCASESGCQSAGPTRRVKPPYDGFWRFLIYSREASFLRLGERPHASKALSSSLLKRFSRPNVRRIAYLLGALGGEQADCFSTEND